MCDYDEELENSLLANIKTEIEELKKRNKDCSTGWDSYQAGIVENSVDRADRHKAITADQAYYVRCRYLRYREDIAVAMRQNRTDWDNGIQEIWCGDIARIPPKYRVHIVSSTWIWYRITPPWYDKTKTNAMLQISNIPGDVFIWKSRKKEIPCIRFRNADASKIKYRFLAPEMRKPESRDEWRW